MSDDTLALPGDALREGVVSAPRDPPSPFASPQCDTIAQGIITAAKEVKLEVPLVVRLEGTNVELGKKMLNASGIKLTTADDLDDAAIKAVAQLK